LKYILQSDCDYEKEDGEAAVCRRAGIEITYKPTANVTCVVIHCYVAVTYF
jgi:hypothetical protein